MEAKCEGKSCKNLETFEASTNVEWEDIKLHEDMFQLKSDFYIFHPLSEYKDAFLDAIKVEIEN